MKFSSFLLTCAAMSGAVSAQPDAINVLADYEAAQGFELMFDGTAESFRNRFANYQQNSTTNTNLHSGWVVNSTLTDPDKPGTAFSAVVNGGANIDIRTRGIYRDFDWRMEYRNGGNQGVFYRFDVSSQYAWNTGIEYAIDNNVTQSNEKFRAGAAYDLMAPSSQEYQVRTTNKWNTMRIVAKGDSVEHWMNGVKVVALRYWSPTFQSAVQNSKWSTVNRYCQTAPNNRTFIPSGYLGLQADHGGAWEIRRMRILHDSTASLNRVKPGPVETGPTTGVLKASGDVPGHRIEKSSRGLRISVHPENRLRAVEVRDFSGRLLRRVQPASGNEAILDESGLRRGLHFLRMETLKGDLYGKTLIP
jgi:hypothetical protein